MIKTVAEIGINHNSEITIAKKLIDITAAAGFSYIKFQKREPDICVPNKQKSIIKQTPWGSMSYIDYKKKMEFNIEEYGEIDDYCRGKIKWFVSVWDIESAKKMIKFCDIIKIPSALITDLDLLKACRDWYKRVIISTGMSTEEEIEEAVAVGNPDIVMHCRSTYPALARELNLDYITWLRDKYTGRTIGYSGHEMGILPSILAVMCGARWIERHVTLDKTMWGSDQFCSLEPSEMFDLIKGIKLAESTLGGYSERKLYESESSKRESLRK